MERFFAGLTMARVRRGSFRNVAELKSAISEYITEVNREPKPYVWTANVETIVGKIRRYTAICDSSH